MIGTLLKLVYFTVVIGGFIHSPSNVIGQVQSALSLTDLPTNFSMAMEGVDVTCDSLKNVYSHSISNHRQHEAAALKFYQNIIDQTSRQIGSDRGCA